MCGINGIVSNIEGCKKGLLKMNDLLKHRGPDDEGYVLINSQTGKFKQLSGNDSISHIKENYKNFESSSLDGYDVSLAHRRLSIIDLSSNGHGPMSSSDEKIWITYNGEIYNYRELREELEQNGFIFRTKTDTEVIINSYILWGADCLNKFNGMWAFGLWDGYKKHLFLARDRFGIKPLYYCLNNDYFAFSSEIKPLVYLSSKKTEINNEKIPFFLLHGNRLNTPETYVKNIFSLQASHYMLFDLEKTETTRYYDVKAKSSSTGSEKEITKKIVEILSDSIKLRFRSDVPVGTCLSGGFDSSSIVSLSTSIGSYNAGLETFSAVWDEKECDESYYIDIVNKKFKCTPNKITPRADEFEQVFKRLNYFQEIPSEGPGLYPQWYVMSMARKKVKVLLDGQGGDEVFGGYFLMGAYLRGLIKDRRIFRILKESKNYMLFLNSKGLHSFAGWMFPKQYDFMAVSRFSGKMDILNKEFLKGIDPRSFYFDAEPPKKFNSYINNLSYHFVSNHTIPSLLHYEDRSSMAHSIESRIPFLDYRLVELGLNLKPGHLSEKGISRPLYRKALEPFLPAEVTQRRDKLGFPTPFSAWSKTILKDYILDILFKKDAWIHEYVNKVKMKQNLDDHFSGKTDYSWEIWRLLSLEQISEMYYSDKNFW
jgi:asparagine synthase (glutamine-hydrolysing)